MVIINKLRFLIISCCKPLMSPSGADLVGGGGGADALTSAIRPAADPKGPPFGTF